MAGRDCACAIPQSGYKCAQPLLVAKKWTLGTGPGSIQGHLYLAWNHSGVCASFASLRFHPGVSRWAWSAGDCEVTVAKIACGFHSSVFAIPSIVGLRWVSLAHPRRARLFCLSGNDQLHRGLCSGGEGRKRRRIEPANEEQTQQASGLSCWNLWKATNEELLLHP